MHQLFVEVNPVLHPRGIGAEYLTSRSSTGAYAAFNLALLWRADAPCGPKVVE